MFNSTIVAISTPFGESGIGIIRMSGMDSFMIADKIFRRRDNKKISELFDHSINYGWIINPKSGEVIDEVLLTIMKKPRTYTKEDMIEINCHGGWISLNRTMDIIIDLGAKIALPGEFTKRAFINGRIDLTQAEAVLDIIKAKTDRGLYSAVKKLDGSIRNKMQDIRKKLLELLSYNNAEIDFSEQVLMNKKREIKIADMVIMDVESLLDQYHRKKAIREGIKVVFCGKTNVGKSSIVNAIYGENKILTSKIHGTTRDCVQLDIYLEGIVFHLIDTAGIRESKTNIEKLCIENSEKEIKSSDCLIMVFDISRKLNYQDERIVRWISKLNKDIIWVINKTDLNERFNFEYLEKIIKTKDVVKISAVNGSGIDKILCELKKRKEKFYDVIEDGLIINNRQKSHLKNIKMGLERIKELYQRGSNEEIISEELKYSIKQLDNITGDGLDSNAVDEIFNQFCIGK